MSISRPPSAQGTGWTVTAQQETSEVGPSGRVESGYRIAFTTAKGVQGTVFVARSQYNPDNVRAQLAAHAAELDQVQGMSG